MTSRATPAPPGGAGGAPALLATLAMIAATPVWPEPDTLQVNTRYHRLQSANERGVDADMLLRSALSPQTHLSIGAAHHEVAGVRWRYAVSGAEWRNAGGGAQVSLQTGSGDNGPDTFTHLVTTAGVFQRLATLNLVVDAEYRHIDSDGPRQAVLSLGTGFPLLPRYWGRVQYTGVRSAGLDGSDRTWLARGDYSGQRFSAWAGYARGEARVDADTRTLLGGQSRRSEWLFAGATLPWRRHTLSAGLALLRRDGEDAQSTLSLGWRAPFGNL